jgi:hypothetical protein
MKMTLSGYDLWRMGNGLAMMIERQEKETRALRLAFLCTEWEGWDTKGNAADNAC